MNGACATASEKKIRANAFRYLNSNLHPQFFVHFFASCSILFIKKIAFRFFLSFFFVCEMETMGSQLKLSLCVLSGLCIEDFNLKYSLIKLGICVMK